MVSETIFKETEIGMIPEEWEVIRLKDYLSIKPRNGIYKSKEYQGNGIKLVKMNTLFDTYYITDQEMELLDLNDEEKKIFLLQEGDLLFARTSLILEGVGKCAIVGKLSEEAAFESNTFRIRLDKMRVNPKYILYLFRSDIGRYYVSTIASQTAATSIKSSDLTNIPISVPPLDEQNKIVNTLYSLDQNIEFNRQMNSTLEQIAQTLFKHWFIDFEFPDEDGNPYKSSSGRMVDSELGEIPEGWEVKQIGTICETSGGGTPKTSEPSYWEEGNVFWATPTDMTSLKSPVIFDTSRKITEKGLQNSSAKLLPAGSILMTSRATLGYFAIAKVPISTNQGFISMICDDRVSNYYLLNAVQNKKDEIENLASGSTFLEINKTSFRSIKIILPSKSIMQKFDDIADSIYERIFQNELETKKLAETRDSLLPKLMSGKIRVQT